MVHAQASAFERWLVHPKLRSVPMGVSRHAGAAFAAAVAARAAAPPFSRRTAEVYVNFKVHAGREAAAHVAYHRFNATNAYRGGGGATGADGGTGGATGADGGTGGATGADGGGGGAATGANRGGGAATGANRGGGAATDANRGGGTATDPEGGGNAATGANRGGGAATDADGGVRNATSCAPFAAPCDREERYFSDLLKARFVLSPRGSKVDCHRHWEILALGAVPAAAPKSDKIPRPPSPAPRTIRVAAAAPPRPASDVQTLSHVRRRRRHGRSASRPRRRRDPPRTSKPPRPRRRRDPPPTSKPSQVPVVLRSPATLELLEGLPAVFLDAWDELTPELLRSRAALLEAVDASGGFAFERLGADFWRREIAAAKSRRVSCDDRRWRRKSSKPEQSCAWAAKKPGERCGITGGGALAAAACPGACSPACRPPRWGTLD